MTQVHSCSRKILNAKHGGQHAGQSHVEDVCFHCHFIKFREPLATKWLWGPGTAAIRIVRGLNFKMNQRIRK